MRSRSLRASFVRTLARCAVASLTLAAWSARAEDTPPVNVERPVNPDQPLMAHTPDQGDVQTSRRDVLVFKSTLLFNEFVYRALVAVPPDAPATPELARRVAGRIANFLREAGYELATVRAQEVDGQIVVTVDEGQLDKVILIGVGADTKVRFKLELNLPQDVFNRPQLEKELPRLVRRFRMKSISYELWPTAQFEEGLQLGDVDSLSALPFFRGGRAYELRILASTDGWGQGFAPELATGGVAGLELGGRWRWANLLRQSDRVEVRGRAAANLRQHLEVRGLYLVVTHLLGEVRWLGPTFSSAERAATRPAITAKTELWQLQREDLGLEGYSVGTIEGAAGVGSQGNNSFNYALTLGVQRRWLYNVNSIDPVLNPKVAAAPTVENRGFTRLTMQYVFNPYDLRRDQRDRIDIDIRLWSLSKFPSTFLRVDVLAPWMVKLGWNELWFTGRVTALGGNWTFLEEEPLGNHLRVGFGGNKYTQSIASLRSEFRYALLRDIVKASVFTDLATYFELPSEQRDRTLGLAGASGLGLNVLAADQFQCDLYLGMGWTTLGWAKPGVALQVKEAF